MSDVPPHTLIETSDITRGGSSSDTCTHIHYHYPYIHTAAVGGLHDFPLLLPLLLSLFFPIHPHTYRRQPLSTLRAQYRTTTHSQSILYSFSTQLARPGCSSSRAHSTAVVFQPRSALHFFIAPRLLSSIQLHPLTLGERPSHPSILRCLSLITRAMTNLSSITEMPQQAHSYDKLSSVPHAAASSFPTSAVSLTYSLPTHATAVHHEGQLYKRSSILKQWHPSYYVLDELTLLTYPSQATYQQVVSQPPSPSNLQFKRLDVREYTVKSLSPSAHNRPYCFTLLSRDTGKEHLFAAPSEQARTGWIDAISKAMKAIETARREKSKSKDKADNAVGRDEGEKSELVGGESGRSKRQEVMSGKGLYSNALITSSSSSSLASITHNMSASASSTSLSSSADVCHSCHSPFTLTVRPVPCTRCARSFCDSCASHTVTVKGGEVDEDRRVCNRCHEGMVAGMTAGVGGEVSGLGGSRRTTKNGLSDEADEVSGEQITIIVPGGSLAAPSVSFPGSSPSTISMSTLPALPPLHTSTSSSEATAVLLTNPAVEATRELISPAPNPSSPPPSPLSPIHPPSFLVGASRPASPTSALHSPSSSSTGAVRHYSPVKLSVKVPESREKDIVVLPKEEIERLEAERRRKGLPDGGARMGSVVIGAPAQKQQQVVVKQMPMAAAQQVPASSQGQRLVKKPWYVCGCAGM